MLGRTLTKALFFILLNSCLITVAGADTVVVGQEHSFRNPKSTDIFPETHTKPGWPELGRKSSAQMVKRPNYLALLPDLKKLPKSDTGYILYTHYETVTETFLGKEIPIPITRIHIMSGEGERQSQLIDPGRYRQAQSPWWSADGRKIVFACDHEMAKSALYMDIFIADLVKDTVTRITGNDWQPQKKQGKGTIYGMIMTNECSFPGRPSEINITCQGLNDAIHHVHGQVQVNPANPNQPNPPQNETAITVVDSGAQPDLTGFQATGYNYTITDVPAGPVWVKCWFSKHLGDLKMVNVPVNGEAQVDTMNLAQGNFLVSHPSLSPDGRYLVVLSENPFTQPESKFYGQPQKQLGFDTIAVVDCQNPGKPPKIWHTTQMGGQYAKDPKLSPDGKWIALALGDTGVESLAVTSLSSLLKGQPDIRIIKSGQRFFDSHSLGNINPAWSPDGKSLSFVHYQMTTTGFNGNLCRINLDGSGFQKLTDLAANQSPGSSSWSPDGLKIAYQLVSSRGPRLHVNDLIMRNIKSDIWVINGDGSKNHSLTIDGRSGEPSWGQPGI